jgi:TatD DNase family protein
MTSHEPASSLWPLIDSHCHLNYDYAPKSESDLVEEAKASGVEFLVTIGTDIPAIGKIASISEKFPNVFHTVGVHPHEAVEMKDTDIDVLRQASQHQKCKAIGEIGLDYHYDHSPRDVQRLRLEQQLDLAVERRLPIVVHSRDGEEDLLDHLTRYAKRVVGGKSPGIIHCFTGTEKFGQACIDLGFYISFSGILTFKKADDLRICAAKFPLERILVETDSPYLAPIPFRGKKCEPSMVRLTCEKLAEVKGISPKEAAEATYRNTRLVFGF